MSADNTPGQSRRPMEILLVDDDDDDVRLIKQTMEKDHIHSRLHRVKDGMQAMEYLRREGSFTKAVRPDLILLDLDMPRKGGREVLEEAKQDLQLRSIPIVVFTTSDNEDDIARSYDQQVNSYVTKPVDLDSFRKALKTLKDYWFSVVRLPCSE